MVHHDVDEDREQPAHHCRSVATPGYSNSTRPRSVWTDDFEGLLPSAVPSLILDLIEAEAVALEQAAKSNT